MKKILSVILFLFLVACEPQNNVGADGYRFYEKEFEQSVVEVKVIPYQSRETFLIAARGRGITDMNIAAFAEIRPPKYTQCTVHIMDPLVSYEPEWYGHEFTHCFYGQWHKNNESR